MGSDTGRRLADRIRRFRAAGVALVALAATLGWTLAQSLALNAGQFAYALDDPYIHLAMARGLVEGGVWGVTPYGFSSTSSSPLWTLLLAVMEAVTISNVWMPFLLNALFAVLVLFALQAVFNRFDVPQPLSAVLLLAVVFTLPLPALPYIGMEHGLQVFLTILFATHATRLIVRETGPGWRSRETLLLWGLALLLVMTRYEGLFVVAPVCLLLALRRRIGHAVVLGVIAIAPVVVYGALSVAGGALLLPNSVYIKSTASEMAGVSDLFRPVAFAQALAGSPFLVLLVVVIVAAAWRYWTHRRLWTPSITLAAIAVLAILLHTLLAELEGHMGRYDMYLVTLALLAFGLAVRDRLGRWRPAAGVLVLGLVALIALAGRAPSTLIAVAGSNDIYSQQYQMAHFLRQYYPAATVAANDVGAITYYTDIHLVDLFGLGTNAVARAKAARESVDAGFYEALTADRGTDIAVIYDSWFEDRIPPGWVKVGTWTLPTVITASENTVSFYAVDPAHADTLRANLRAYRSRLPEEVIVTILDPT